MIAEPLQQSSGEPRDRLPPQGPRDGLRGRQWVSDRRNAHGTISKTPQTLGTPGDT